MNFIIVSNKKYVKVIDVTDYSIGDIDKTYEFYTRAGFETEWECINVSELQE